MLSGRGERFGRFKMAAEGDDWRVYPGEPMEAYAVMFHHFHRTGTKPIGQGSITEADLEQMVLFLESRKKGRILSAAEFQRRWVEKSLEAYHVCLTFDYGLRGQYDIAVPVLEKHALTGFFFVYTDIHSGTFEPMETLRYFQKLHYKVVTDFHNDFIRVAAEKLAKEENLDAMDAIEKDEIKKLWKPHLTMYSDLDRQFRYVRDVLLTPAKLEEVVSSMMKQKGFERNREVAAKIWISEKILREMSEQGHSVGLHSASHPSDMHRVTAAEANVQYGRNFESVRKITGKDPTAMSHPLGNWNEDVLGVLRKLNIQVGFTVKPTRGRTDFEIPRIDHCDVLNGMKAVSEQYLDSFHPLLSSPRSRPRITLFTSNQRRHVALVNKLAAVASSVHVVQECITIAPGEKKSVIYDKSETMKEYFSRVKAAEEKVFPLEGVNCFSPGNVSTLGLTMGDINHVDPEVLRPALSADLYVVFGASFIKGWLIDFLVQHRCINLHIGVSPYMRGSSCNFWAMAKNRPDLVGATAHLIGKGLDSGPMLWHAKPSAEGKYDNSFEFTMRAVDVVQNSLVSYIRSGKLPTMTPVTQDKSKEVFYSRYQDFDDDVAAAFLKTDSLVTGTEHVRMRLRTQDKALFYNLYEE